MSWIELFPHAYVYMYVVAKLVAIFPTGFEHIVFVLHGPTPITAPNCFSLCVRFVTGSDLGKVNKFVFFLTDPTTQRPSSSDRRVVDSIF